MSEKNGSAKTGIILRIVSLVLAVVPAAVLFIPCCTLTAKFPYFSKVYQFSLQGINAMRADGSLELAKTLSDSEIVGGVTSACVALTYALIVSAVIAALLLIAAGLNFSKAKAIRVIMAVVCAVGLGISAYTTYITCSLIKLAQGSGIFSLQGTLLPVASCVAYAALLAICIMLLVKTSKKSKKEVGENE